MLNLVQSYDDADDAEIAAKFTFTHNKLVELKCRYNLFNSPL